MCVSPPCKSSSATRASGMGTVPLDVVNARQCKAPESPWHHVGHLARPANTPTLCECPRAPIAWIENGLKWHRCRGEQAAPSWGDEDILCAEGCAPNGIGVPQEPLPRAPCWSLRIGPHGAAVPRAINRANTGCIRTNNILTCSAATVSATHLFPTGNFVHSSLCIKIHHFVSVLYP